MRRSLIALFLAVLAPAAVAQGVYKCVEPDGRVVYTDNPKACKGNAVQVEAPPPAGAKPAAGLTPGEREFARQADKRAADLASATDDIVASFNALRAAEAKRDAGIEPIEGERQGRRYRPEYWERQQGLKHEVDEARSQLDQALARRNALR